MQIDFHHATTYVIARLAGFAHSQAVVIAYASQYVDDSVNQGVVHFDRREPYARIASAHKLFDPRNIHNPEAYLVWLPFHFLPGNNGAEAGQVAASVPLQQRILCTPDSPLANELWQACRRRKSEAGALHRLGITAHVYCDTFAHQHFAGLSHDVNRVHDLTATSHLSEEIANRYQSTAADLLRIGHGGALTCPDLPFLEWRYENWSRTTRLRNNQAVFRLAGQRLFEHFVAYLDLEVPRPMRTDDQEKLGKLFADLVFIGGEERHTAWLAAIHSGLFSFGPLNGEEFAQLQYAPDGKESWRYKALGFDQPSDPPGAVAAYDPRFESSDWKLFHDALKEHRDSVLEELLPAYGLPGSYEQAQALGL